MGWAEGLNAGINLGNVIKQGMLQQDLADEAKKYKVTEGAYGPALSENLQGVISARDQALQGLGENATPEQIQQVHAQYTPAMAELSRRVGLTAPDYSVNSGQQNFADRQGAEYAASQARTAGLADVYRSHGQVDKAEELTARAQQQQLTGLQLNKAKREDDAETRYANFGQFAAQNPDMTAAQLKEAAQSQFKFTPEQWEKAVTTRLNIEKADLDMFKANVSKKMQGKSLAQLGSLYNTDPDFDDKTDLAIVPGKGGAVTLNFLDKANNNKVVSSQSFANEALAVEYLHTQAKQPEVMGSWLLGVQTKEQQIVASKASVNASNASASLSGLRAKALGAEIDNREEAAKLESQYSALTDAEKAGPKGQGLIRQFNMLNVKAGGQISLGTQQRPGQTMTDVEKANLTEYYKWAHDDRNARLPQAEKDKKATQMGVYDFVNPSTNVVQSGLGSNPYANTGGKTDQGSGKQQGIQTAPPKLTSMNTRLLGRAGNMGYNVELPDGTTRVMEKDELEDLGYRFPAAR